MEQILDEYYANNARKLRRVVDRILLKFGGLYDKDRDDFYSLANEVFVDAMRKYDGVQPFDGFLYSCLKYKILSEITRRNRGKRKADREAVPIDMPIGEDGGCTLADLIPGSFDMEGEVLGRMGIMPYKLGRYLSLLSRWQREVLYLLAECYRAEEIQRMLHMTQKEYMDALEAMRSYEKIRVLL